MLEPKLYRYTCSVLPYTIRENSGLNVLIMFLSRLIAHLSSCTQRTARQRQSRNCLLKYSNNVPMYLIDTENPHMVTPNTWPIQPIAFLEITCIRILTQWILLSINSRNWTLAVVMICSQCLNKWIKFIDVFLRIIASGRVQSVN